MEVLLLHNEAAGSGEHTRASLTSLVQRAGYAPVYRDLHQAIGSSDLFNIGEFVVVAGGDGSIRKVALALLGHERALAPLPLGTANNIAHALGLGPSLDTIARGWAEGRRRRLDIGHVTGPWGRRPFVEGIGLGLFPRMITISEYLHPAVRGAGAKPTRAHKLTRDRSVFAALAHEVAAHPTQLSVDGHDASGALVLLEVLNINRVGPGVELAPAADPFDGNFDAVIITAAQRGKLQEQLRTAIADGQSSAPLSTRGTRNLRIVTRAPELRIDDEVIVLEGETHLEIELQPAALEIVLPAAS